MRKNKKINQLNKQEKETIKHMVEDLTNKMNEYKTTNDLRYVIEKGICETKNLKLIPLSINVMDMILDVAAAFGELETIDIDNENKCFYLKKPIEDMHYQVVEYLFHMNDMEWLKFENAPKQLS